MGGGFQSAAALNGLLGGLMIGLATAIMLLGLGRVAGVSGMTARSLGLSRDGPPWPWASAFVIGLPLGAGMVAALVGPVLTRFPTSPIELILGGFLVGFGTRLGNGCTSGHGVCGLSRGSIRSLAATLTFIASGVATVVIMRLLGIGR